MFRIHTEFQRRAILSLFSASLLGFSTSSFAQPKPDDPAVEACRASGLIALKEQSPSIKDLIFDMETIAVSKANTSVEDVPVRGVVMGEAYFERKEAGQAHRFVCLIGEKGKVLLTFFTSQ